MKRSSSKLKLVLTVFFALGVLSVFGLSSRTAVAANDGADQACQGLSALGVDCDSGASDAQAVAAKPIETIVKLLTFIVGAASVIMIIYGALRFITSGGNSDSAKSARSIIIYALVGLVLALLANVIISFTFKQAKDIESKVLDSSRMV